MSGVYVGYAIETIVIVDKKKNIVAMDDGIRRIAWTKVVKPADIRNLGQKDISELTPAERSLVEWARKNKGKRKFFSEVSGKTPVVRKIDGTRVRVMVFSREKEVLDALKDALRVAAKAWKWKPGVVTLEERTLRSQSLGAAYSPGSGEKFGRVIALSPTTISEYDKKSIKRVIIHELCHHFREESFPRSQQKMIKDGGHDRVFCSQLHLADPLSRGADCSKFNSSVSIAFVQKTGESLYPDASWAPSAGVIRVEADGIRWVPVKKGSWKTPVIKGQEKGIMYLALKFPRSSWAKVKTERPYAYDGKKASNLNELVRFMAPDSEGLQKLMKGKKR